MFESTPDQAVEFLGKTYALEEVAIEPALESARHLVVKAAPRLELRWSELDPSFFSKDRAAYDLRRPEDAPTVASIQVDGYEYPIVEATVHCVRQESSLLFVLEGTAESVEYEGCDEVAKLVPFRAKFFLREE
ncbi:MAG: hypothetical protein C4317_09425 [Acidimicrobiia bacterium]